MSADPPTALRRRLLLEPLGVAVSDFRCHAHVEPLGPEEPNRTHGLAFVRKGVFQRTHEGHTLVADANHVLFFNAGARRVTPLLEALHEDEDHEGGHGEDQREKQAALHGLGPGSHR